jgi:hypothetical protein
MTVIEDNVRPTLLRPPEHDENKSLIENVLDVTELKVLGTVSFASSLITLLLPHAALHARVEDRIPARISTQTHGTAWHGTAQHSIKAYKHKIHSVLLSHYRIFSQIRNRSGILLAPAASTVALSSRNVSPLRKRQSQRRF